VTTDEAMAPDGIVFWVQKK